MNVLAERLLEDAWQRLMEIYGKEKKRIDGIKDWSKLQDGIMRYLKMTRMLPKYGKPPLDLAIDVYEPFSWRSDAYTFELGAYIDEVTDEMLEREFWPALLQRLDELRRSGEMGPHFFHYRFECRLEFPRFEEESPLKLEASSVDEQKKEALREELERFVQTKVLSEPPARPKPEDGFFFARLLVNPDFLPEGRRVPDPRRIEALSAALENKFRAQPERLAAWRREYVRALIGWSEEYFLPIYCRAHDDYSWKFDPLPEDQRPEVDPEAMELFLYVALKIGPSEPERRSDYLNYARELGSEQAERYLRNGSGMIESARKGNSFRGQANDVLQTIELKLETEDEEAYREALEYLRDLLRQGFPRSYSLKLKSTEKRLLPIKKLAKSPLHRFFANALHYPALFPLIAEYAQLAMEEFAWYNDVSPGEKSVMPGTYAVLGLGLAGSEYDELLIRYMRLVDTEHQSAHDDYPSVFFEARGLDENTMPVFVEILLGGGQSARPLKEHPIATPDSARMLQRRLEPLEKHERELILYRLFGGEEKLLRSAKKADPEMREALMALCE
ncbi:hypothetical protein CDO73_06945 [Saccharibacillus sp. O23]|uniref:DUF6138 family protein n=1 Tax=Saccharibacillus sp. O23 TaxID=2009338 RepID=UPI000B4E4E37|nr:DUF6138 family protein [Saccharibacillus sp. O23]OWR31458.1 hypothetical protein CDO73_06945 [Saccharibacillus sp. O23]